MTQTLDILIDSLRSSILITGMVVVMMLLIESLNIESHGRVFSKMRNSRLGGIVVSTLLGLMPGCMGGFASVSLYTHGMLSFGALVAMMIATSGDEAFVMFAMFPGTALELTALLFVVAVLTGLLVDIAGGGKRHGVGGCCCEMKVHDEDMSEEMGLAEKKRHFSLHRFTLLLGVGLYLGALGFGLLEHEHVGETAVSLNFLSEDNMNVFFAVLGVVLLFIVALGSDHFVEEHLWNHIIKKHLPKLFSWTFSVLVFLGSAMDLLDVEGWVNENIPMMIILATLVGIIPESGPHLAFVTLFAAGVIPLPVLVASCISQDGHACIPLLAESKGAFLRAKAINCVVALAVGFAMWGFDL